MWGDVCESHMEDSQGSGSSGTRKQSPNWDRCVVLIGAYSVSCPFMETALLASKLCLTLSRPQPVNHSRTICDL